MSRIANAKFVVRSLSTVVKPVEAYAQPLYPKMTAVVHPSRLFGQPLAAQPVELAAVPGKQVDKAHDFIKKHRESRKKAPAKDIEGGKEVECPPDEKYLKYKELLRKVAVTTQARAVDLEDHLSH
eukprot:1349676-Rhodomonas_salina.5